MDEVSIRPSVAQFAALIDQRIGANATKGNWKATPCWRLFAELARSMTQLEKLVNMHGTVLPCHVDEVRQRAADVGAYAMFIVDVVTKGEING